jgi:hypothetical protein
VGLPPVTVTVAAANPVVPVPTKPTLVFVTVIASACACVEDRGVELGPARDEDVAALAVWERRAPARSQ